MTTLMKARAVVQRAQEWIDAIDEHGIVEPGEIDLAYEAYHSAAENFFELWDEMRSETE